MGSPKCLSCRFFRSDPSQYRGICTHPDRQNRGAPITVRANELHCYRGFGMCDWMPAVVGQTPILQDIVISERPAPFRRPTPFSVFDPQPGADSAEVQ
jgi:hypothetical protein